MRSLRDVGREPLTLVRAGFFSRVYHLLAGAERVATLRESNFTGRRATFESAEGVWLIQRHSWFHKHFVVIDQASNREIAHFHHVWFHRGTLELENGMSYEWRVLDFWRTRRGFLSQNGDPVVLVQRRIPPFRSRALVTIEDPGRLSPSELMTVVAAACYRYVRERRRPK